MHQEMATSTTQQEMAVITVKNTFLNIKKVAGSGQQRSSSVPRAFKLGDNAWFSDDSTNASDKDTLHTPSDDEEDFPDYCSTCTDDQMDFMQSCEDNCSECCSDRQASSTSQDDADQSKVTVKLSLSDMVTENSEKVRLKLRPSARPFKSVRAPPAEVTSMIASAVTVLSSGMDIVDVQVCDGGMGGTTLIHASSTSTNPDAQWLFTMVKDALLSSAEQSENSYILGYGAQPFNNLDQLSFSANICCMPAAHRDTACWDFYEKGSCPRRATCRWDHPSDADMMRVIIMVKKAAESDALA